MPNNITWIEVADTAVKIGLSGTIAAIGGYVLARRTQKHDFDKDYFRRRQDVIEKVSDGFASIHAFFFRVCVDYMNQVEIFQIMAPTDQDLKKYSKFIHEIGENLHELHVLEGKLFVVGAADAVRSLQEYRLEATNVNNMLKLNKPTMNKSDVEAVTEELFTKKDRFYAELAKAFRAI